jgi:chemotaxis protein methyltransferase CheR
MYHLAGNWDFTRFKKEFFQYTGLDLECYKDKQMERRIGQLMVREGFGDLSDFFAALKTSDHYLHKFYTYLTINTSVFYRDTKIYDYLQKTALVDLLARFEKINIWSLGCSHGEEPYTIALILDDLSALNRASITASDIDDKVLEMAREARYAPNQLEKVPPQILKSAFRQDDGCYYLVPKYKRTVNFKKQNLLNPIYNNSSPIHLALCRNVFIYFKTDVQERIIGQVARLIPPGGYFIIGCAEFINKPEQFNLERLIPSIYLKTG